MNSEIVEGQKVQLKERFPWFDEGKVVTVTEVDQEKTFPYELNGGEDRVKRDIIEITHCECGQRLLYHDKREEWVCPWCEDL